MTQITAPWLTDKPAQRVCALLTDAGYQAWFVGGCVRNALLGEPVADLDLSTDARPDVVTKLAQAAGLKVIPTGIDHGTVTVLAENTPFEITTFRRDVATDGRRATVAFADTMAEDALRRDFTMNALYAGADGHVADPVGGLDDLQARRFRFIEDADQRIKEDYLRILRFFRFHAWYGDADAGIEPEGLAACASNIEGLQQLSVERITSEMLKLLDAPNPAPALSAFAATGGLAQILPGATAATLPVLVHVEQSADLHPDPLRRLAVLSGAAKDAFRLSKAQMTVLDQISSDMSHAEAAYRFGADIGTHRLAIDAAMHGQELDLAAVAQLKEAANMTFPLTAADLMPAYQGAALGQALKSAEQRWIASGFTLTKAELTG